MNDLSLANIKAQSVLDQHESAIAIAQTANSDGQLSQQQHSISVPQDAINTCSVLFAALDELQQAAMQGMRTAKAAVKPAPCSTAVDMQEVLASLLTLTEAAYQAQTSLRQHAECGGVTATGAGRQPVVPTAENAPALAGAAGIGMQ